MFNVLSLCHRSKRDCQSTCHGRNRLLPPKEEFFMVLVRLRLGLFEKDLADRFSVSNSTVSRICRTWITFLYMRLGELPLWPSRDLVQSYMPRSFKDLYPSTRVIIDHRNLCRNTFIARTTTNDIFFI